MTKVETFVAAVIRAPHGLSGELKVESTSVEVEHLLRLKTARVRHGGGEPQIYSVERASLHGTTLYMKFRGFDAPEIASALTGGEIIVERKDASPLKDGEVYVEDLKRCGLFYQGQQVASIRDVIEGGNGNLLEVDLLPVCSDLGIEAVSAKSGEARRVLVPYKEQFVGRVDTEQGTVELKSLWILE